MDYASEGKLYIVSTPIGNIKDITLRALEVIQEVDILFSEDTRETYKILQKYNIKTPQIPYTDHNHKKVVKHALESLGQSKNIALISDSGTPLISDPGFSLVYDVRKAGYEVVSIPGACSVTAALSICGLPTDKFSFLGFLPKTKSKKGKVLKDFGSKEASLVIFESPYRINNLIKELGEVLGNRAVCVLKDITKRYENVKTGYLDDIKNEKLKEKGEYVVVVAKEGFKIDG